jgi:hypothetical protein
MCFAAIGAALLPAGASAAAATSAGIAAVGTAVSVASSGLQYAGQQQQAKAQAKYQKQAQEAERQRFQQEQTAINIRKAQEQKAANEELSDIARNTVKAADIAAMKAQARGVTGLSVEAVIDNMYAQGGNVEFRLAQQQEMGATAAAMAFEQAGFVTTQRQIGLSKPIKRPSLALAGMQALSGSIEAYGRGRQIGATYED